MRAMGYATCLTAVILAVGACTSQPPEFSAEDESRVRAMFDSTVANIRAGDWTTWSRQFAEDAVLYPPNARSVVGRPAILSWGQAFPPVEEFSFSDVEVVGEGNMAHGTSAYVLKLRGAPADTGKQLVVFRRSAGGSWEIPAGAFNSNLAVPAPQATSASPPR